MLLPGGECVLPFEKPPTNYTMQLLCVLDELHVILTVFLPSPLSLLSMMMFYKRPDHCNCVHAKSLGGSCDTCYTEAFPKR